MNPKADRFLVNRDPGDEQPDDHVHDPICNGMGTARGKEWPMCCGSDRDIEEFYDEHFDDYYDVF